VRLKRSPDSDLLYLLALGLVAASLFFTAGCAAAAPEQKAAVSQDGVLVPYIKRFESEVGVSAAQISARFVGVMYEAGLCNRNSGGAEIVLNRKTWDGATESIREEMVYHELGHCALGRGHNAARAPGGCPVSIMYPAVFGDPCFSGDRAGYVAELRGGR
jgi:hypothetical protein